MEKQKVYFTEFRIGKDRTVKIMYADPRFKNLKISRYLKENPNVTEKDIIVEDGVETRFI